MRRPRILLLVAFGCLLGIIGAIVALTALTYGQEAPVLSPGPPPVVGKGPPVVPPPGPPRPGAPVGIAPKDKPSDWAAAAWQWAINQGIVDGREPKKPCTREMAITWLYRYDQREAQERGQMEWERERREREEERAATALVPVSAPETPSPSGLLLSDLNCYRTPADGLGLDSFPSLGVPIRVLGKINNTGSEPVELAGDVVGIEGYDEEGRLVIAEVLSTTPTAPPSFSMLPLEAISGKPYVGPTHVVPSGYATFQVGIVGAPSVANVKVRVLR